MLEPVAPGVPMARAFLRLGGASLARHQLAMAHALGCGRIVCTARRLSPDLIAMQHDVEAAGLQFSMISDTRGLMRLVGASDEVIVIGDGLVATPDAARQMLGSGSMVLVQPVETGTKAGFERIDLNHAVGGAMRIPGHVVEGLAQLPEDCDIPSALVRIALQAGTAMREVPADLRASSDWRLLRSENDVAALENDWIRAATQAEGAPGPSAMLAGLAVGTFGSRLLQGGHGSRTPVLVGALLILLAIAAGWMGTAVAAFVLIAGAAIAVLIAARIEAIERIGSAGRTASALSHSEIAAALADIAMVLVIVWNTPVNPWDTLLDRTFAPLALILLVRFAPRFLAPGLAAWVCDRAMLCMILAVAAGAGGLVGAVKLLVVAFALAGAFFARSDMRITRA